jgi:integrase
MSVYRLIPYERETVITINDDDNTARVFTWQRRYFKAYRARETAAGVAHATINYRFALIRAALNLETKQTPSRVGKVPYIPIVHVNNTREGFLEYEDHTSLLDALPRSLHALFVIAFHSGCRLGEVLNMRWLDVDWKKQNHPSAENEERHEAQPAFLGWR